MSENYITFPDHSKQFLDFLHLPLDPDGSPNKVKSFIPWYFSILKYIPTTYIYVLINKIPQFSGT